MAESDQEMRWMYGLGRLFTLVGTVGMCGSAMAVGVADYKGEVVLYAFFFVWVFFLKSSKIDFAFYCIQL